MHPALKAFVRSQVAAEQRRQVKNWAIRWADAVELSFSVSEVRCSDPGCADVETVILVMAEGQPTRCARIALPLAGVTRADVVRALARLAIVCSSSQCLDRVPTWQEDP